MSLNKSHQKALNLEENLDSLLLKVENSIKEMKLVREELKKIKQTYITEQKKLSDKKAKLHSEPTGINKQLEIPDKLAHLVGENKGVKMTQAQYTSKFYKNVLEKRGLFLVDNKKVLRADDEILELFNLDPVVNSSTSDKDKNGFNFYTLPKYISRAIKNERLLQEAQQPVITDSPTTNVKNKIK